MKSIVVVAAYAALVLAAPRDETTEYNGNCEKSPRAICAQSSKMSKGDPALNNVTATNYARCDADEDFWIQPADELLKPADAVYNGTVFLQATPPGDSKCPAQSQNSTYGYQLRIGSTGEIPGTNLTRSYYDGNPFYMFLTYFNPKGAWDTSTKNLTTAGDVYMVSSQSWYEYGQHWTLNATKSGDGFDIAGTLTSHKYADNQGMWYRIGNCASTFESWDFGTDFLIADCNVIAMSMTGRITPETAEIKLKTQVFAQPSNPVLEYTFTGKAIPGPKLVTTGDKPSTDGKLGDAAEKNGASAKGQSWIVVGIAVGVFATWL